MDGVVAPGRHVASWEELSLSEQMGLLGELGQHLKHDVRIAVDRIDGHLVLKIANEIESSPSVLVTGGADRLFDHLVQHIDAAEQIDIAVAFALESGVSLIEPYLRDLLDRGGRLRVIVGDYLDVTEPSALRRLADLPDPAEVLIYQSNGTSFHPKAWLLRAAKKSVAIVGSSNISRTALTEGVEWNLSVARQEEWRMVGDAFEKLALSPNIQALTHDWIDQYAARRAFDERKVVADGVGEPPSDLLETPEPHIIQLEALEALKKTRLEGKSAGLVVLATGLGKTWLSAFDSLNFGKVLFVAHREEILSQAMTTFRKIRPEARFGFFKGNKKESGEVLFASVQTLAKAEHLRDFDPREFDYVIVDEFHHASAATYRKLIDYFQPQFLLGLTATPDRTDGADIAALCDDNWVYRCDLYDGITRGHLAPFHYFGVPDDVDYEQIPWRSSKFDIEELTNAVATQARAENALEQLKKHGNGPAIGFCVSKRHAEFMAKFFAEAGLKSVAVHSGEGSAPRTSSLEALGRGEIDILFAVDMFNEGVDVPEIGTVMMLRPTESAILFLQQLGRGLRKYEDKILRVIDYIGNHRIFLTKARALLLAHEGDRSLSQRFEDLEKGQLELPPGCEITYELQAIEVLRSLLKTNLAQDEAEAWFRSQIVRNGHRPTAAQFAEAGFQPGRTGHGLWSDFLRDMGERVPTQAELPTDVFRFLERNKFEDAVEPTILLLMARCGEQNVADLKRETERNVAEHFSQFTLESHIDEALQNLTNARILTREGGRIGFAQAISSFSTEHIQELADWRLSEFEGRGKTAGLNEPQSTFGMPELWHEYMREEIPPLFGAEFNPGNWNSGIVKIDGGLVLLTTLKKGGLSAGNHYKDGFISDRLMQWQSQTSTKRESERGQLLSGQKAGQVHLFVRAHKLRGGTAAPFLYLGQPRFVRWHGDAPITIEWELQEAVPSRYHKAFGIELSV
jgi:superfamily II DNA or RNA helicase/HKD family nuclease